MIQETRRSSTIPQDDVAANTRAAPHLEVVRFVCGLVMSMLDACGGATLLGCLARTPSLQGAQGHSEGSWLGPVTVLATQEMLLLDT